MVPSKVIQIVNKIQKLQEKLCDTEHIFKVKKELLKRLVEREYRITIEVFYKDEGHDRVFLDHMYGNRALEPNGHVYQAMILDVEHVCNHLQEEIKEITGEIARLYKALEDNNSDVDIK